jgi:cobalt-precorrin 5A hydrolase
LSQIAIVAITKHGIKIAREIQGKLPGVQIFAPVKHSDAGTDVMWYGEQTTQLIRTLFNSKDSLICIFSLGATIRMVAPLLKDKRTDPAILVIDDAANFVISVLSGHLGGANILAQRIASLIGAQPVITTAADVNRTIAVDLVGRELGWEIENTENITRVSALMVNEEKVAVFQSAGEINWWRDKLPDNVVSVNSLDEAKASTFKAALIISDLKISDFELLEKSVIYRPKSLVVGIGLHRDTSRNAIESGVRDVFDRAGLALTSIKKIATIKREANVEGLVDFCNARGLPIDAYPKEDLASVRVPNPSSVVQKFEGTTSVSEAAALLSSSGDLIVEKQKFPPDLTVAVCRLRYK